MPHVDLTVDVVDRVLVAVGLIVTVWSSGIVYLLIRSVERRECKTMDLVLKSAASAIRSRPVKPKA